VKKITTSCFTSNISTVEFVANCSLRMKKIRLLRDQIVAAGDAPAIESTVSPLAKIDIELDAALNSSELLESVHPDEGMREAAEKCHRQMAKLASVLELDRELYDSVVTLDSAGIVEDEQTRRFVAHSLRDFRRAGVDKDKTARTRIEKLNTELVALSQEFNRNIRNDTRFIEIDDVSGLAGLPADYVDAHQPGENGKIRITTDYPDLVPFMNYAQNTEFRRQLHFEYMNRAYPANDAVLVKILKARHELANLVGHRSWASHISADKMIGSADAIAKFVDEIAKTASSRSKRDYQQLLDYKVRETPDAKTVEDYEKAYIAEQVRSETLGFDSQEIRPYLEYEKVKDGVLAVTQKLFKLTYVRAQETAWHESVETYDILDGETPIGRFHLDMHPRDGKYKHAAMFPIISGVSGVQLPEAAMVCNFPDPKKATGPALLEHSDVVTFFHEFGHCLHHILGGKQQYSRFSGVATEWDFVEVPSQFLEEWAYAEETLSTFAFHARTGEKIPAELVQRMNHARTFGRGARVRTQMFYAALSLDYHDRDPEGIDTTEVLKEIQTKYNPYAHVEGTNLQASFGHLEGYSALYYTYMWSLVIVRDLFGRFLGHSLFDSGLALHYRQKVLEPGGSRDAVQLIHDFLDRDYNLEAFCQWVEDGE
jgi:Zn-dependent oligopeptidase